MKWSEVLQAVKSLIIIFSIFTASFKLDKIIDALGKFIERIFLIPSIIKRKRLENERYECFTQSLPNIINDSSLSPNIIEDMLRSMLKDSMQLQKEDPHKQPHTLTPERDDNSNENEKALQNLFHWITSEKKNEKKKAL